MSNTDNTQDKGLNISNNWFIQVIKGMGLAGLDSYQIKDDDNKLVATIYGSNDGNLKDNAKAIQQVPRMIEALETAYNTLLNDCGYNGIALDDIEAIFKKLGIENKLKS